MGWIRNNSKSNESAKEFYRIFKSSHEFHYALGISGVRNLLEKKYNYFVDKFDILLDQFQKENQPEKIIMRY